jgi:hypothetical protein
MSFVFYFKPEFKAPYRSDGIEESCKLAHDYFSVILDYFIETLPEDRLHVDLCDRNDGTPRLADRIHLIFPNGFGKPDVNCNHNPYVWTVLLALSDAVHEGTCQAFARELCESWEGTYDLDGRRKDEIGSIQRIFGWITSYLQLFVVLSDRDSTNLDFKYPPEDESGVLIGSSFRKPSFLSEV